MGNVTVKNRTDLTDFSALIRVGMYLVGETEEAESDGYRFKIKSTTNGMTVRVIQIKK